MNTPKFVWIIDQSKIEVIFDDHYEIKRSHITIKNHRDQLINVESIETYEDCVVLNTTKELDFSDNYYVTVGEQSLNAYFRRDVLDAHFTYSGKLGPQVNGAKLNLNFWSPPATEVSFILYDKNDVELKLATIPMKKEDKGVWNLSWDSSELKIQDLHQYFYHIEVTVFGIRKLALDPYALSMEANDGSKGIIALKGALIDLSQTNPEGHSESKKINSDLMENELDFVAQEHHVRDFTISKSSKVAKELRGTYLGFCERVDHLKKLGPTHIQFMPLQSYYTVDETNRKYQDERVPTENVNYNWGYDTHHYFIPSGWPSSDPTSPAARITELKKMIQTLHNNDIGAVLDVVYNHNFSRHFLEDVAPGCYLRRTRDGYISTFTGAGDSLETRTKMVRRLITDSLKFYAEEYHFNGFRFDLMGFMDHKTMKAIREELGEDIILYGEAWEFTDIPHNEAATKRHLPEGIELGAFNDSVRNSYVGEKGTRGFVQGDYDLGPRSKAGIIGSIRGYKTDYNDDGHLDAFIDQFDYHAFAKGPVNTINYLSIHDGHTLWDKINLSTPDDFFGKVRMHKLALGMLLTSQGRIVLEAGMEMARTKPLAPNDPNPHRAHITSFVGHEDGHPVKLHENTYKSPDLTNMYDWTRLEKFEEVNDYLAGLIKVRRKFSCLRLCTAEEINDNLRFKVENIPNTPRFVTRDGTRFHSWRDVETLSVSFINGPFNQNLYIIGEVHGQYHKNPKQNNLKIEFNKYGEGQIHFNKKAIKDFDFGCWGDPDGIQLKLVKSPGEWDVPEEYYSKMGSNTIYPWSINNKTGLATVDLGIRNHTAGEGEIMMNQHIAYTLNCIKNSGKLLVIHNSSKQYIDLQIQEIAEYASHEVLVDNLHAGTEALHTTAVKLSKNGIKVPGKSTAVVHLY